MSKSAVKHRKLYVDRPSGESKICLIHCPGHSSNECKVLGDLGAKYAKGDPTEDHDNYPVPRNKFNRRQDNNYILNSAVNKFILHKTQKLSAAKEAPEFLEYDFDDKKLY